MNYFFTSESVSEGHPDKVADQISDAILDQLLAGDPNSRVACETLVTTGQVIVSGEVRSNAYVDLDATVRQVVDRIGYNKPEYGFDAHSCGILSAIHDQSNDINRGVDRDNPEEQGDWLWMTRSGMALRLSKERPLMHCLRSSARCATTARQATSSCRSSSREAMSATDTAHHHRPLP